ncbi:YoaK family protein [Rhodococcus tibetensis]|uniref:YoaK family protein n=1 Tax=Rhodococcus tibetensis TaxID=2965064 RepID=A0ABT1QDM6_9NOCA|nr:YoaK family protein [Rhodococcus sp. FXJ9.536]MCQ4120350.1 YoaK family protein [Rhodococcus sp. FXJ9.536]
MCVVPIDDSRRMLSLAVVLAVLAGYVDALGFITLGGFFVAFMSGNLTRFSVGFAEGTWAHALTAAAVIAVFVLGTVLGAVIVHLTDRRNLPVKTTVLAAVSSLLLAGSLAASLDASTVAVGAMLLAMGAENSFFQRDGEVTVGLTYMTGALVKMGHRLAGAMFGGSPWAWLRHFALWIGLVVGAITGTLAHRWVGLEALWFAAVPATALTLLVHRTVDRATPRPQSS